MKIKDLRIHSIAIADPPLRSSYGLHAPYALRTILELESEDGIIGVNETYGGETPAAALRSIRDKLIGADPFRITGILNPEMRNKTMDRTDHRLFLCQVKIRWTKRRAHTPLLR